MKTSITQIWMVCHLLPFAKVGQYNSKQWQDLIDTGKTCQNIIKEKSNRAEIELEMSGRLP